MNHFLRIWGAPGHLLVLLVVWGRGWCGGTQELCWGCGEGTILYCKTNKKKPCFSKTRSDAKQVIELQA